MTTDLVVVIIGGGMQGLVALDTLTERGYGYALVKRLARWAPARRFTPTGFCSLDSAS